MHLGEPGNISYLRPNYARAIAVGSIAENAPSILRTRRIISEWTKEEADALTEKVMKLKTATEVKAMLQAAAK